MAIIRATGASGVGLAHRQRRMWLRTSVKTAGLAGLLWGSGMFLFTAVLEVISGGWGTWLQAALVWLLGGATYGLFMLPVIASQLRQVQRTIPLDGAAHRARAIAALRTTLDKAKYVAEAELPDFLQYRPRRRTDPSVELLRIRVQLFEEELVVHGPAGVVGALLRRAKLGQGRAR